LRVWGLGFRDLGNPQPGEEVEAHVVHPPRFRIQDSGPRAQGFGFEVPGFGV
jgi:hypothetical protein